ncbi:12131_t:CDS:2, partial [Ambispora leptoticha]
FVSIDSSGLKVNYTDPSDHKAVVIRANNPIPSQCGLFYFEIEIINEGKNGMIGVGYCTKQSNINDFILGIASYLPNNLDDLKNNLYPCIGLRSQDASVEANFGCKKSMTNDFIGKELWEACWINSKTFDQYVDELKNKPNDTFALISRGKAYLIIGKYKEA